MDSYCELTIQTSLHYQFLLLIKKYVHAREIEDLSIQAF